MITRRSAALLTLTLALTAFGATSSAAQSARGANEAFSAAAPTLIDGVYQMRATREEFAAVDPNRVWRSPFYVDTVWLDRGWVRGIEESDAESGWASGMFSVKGDRVVVRWAAADGLPSGSRIKPPEVWTLRWSLFGDQLTLEVLPGAEPCTCTVKPWRRIADAPSVTFKTPASALVGVWTNGRRRLVLRKGRFSLGKKAAKPPRGNTYEILGDAIRFRTKLGEFWDYTWKIEDGRLELSHPPGNSRFPYWNGELIRKPWRRMPR